MCLRLACGLSLANVVFLWLANCGFVAGSWCVCLHTQGLLSFGTWATAVLFFFFFFGLPQATTTLRPVRCWHRFTGLPFGVRLHVCVTSQPESNKRNVIFFHFVVFVLVPQPLPLRCLPLQNHVSATTSVCRHSWSAACCVSVLCSLFFSFVLSNASS